MSNLILLSQIRLTLIFVTKVQCLTGPGPSCREGGRPCSHESLVGLVERREHDPVEGARGRLPGQRRLRGGALAQTGPEIAPGPWTPRLNVIMLEISDTARWFGLIILGILPLEGHLAVRAAAHLLNLLELEFVPCVR